MRDKLADLGYTKDELASMLRVERLATTQRILVLKRQMREASREIAQLEQRLSDIDQSEGYLQ